jgi:ribosomal protein L7/L12
MSCGSPLNSSSSKSATRGASSSRSSTYSVELCDTGRRMIQVMAVVAAETGRGTSETQRMLASLPCTLSSGLAEGDARQLADKVSSAGATVRVLAT